MERTQNGHAQTQDVCEYANKIFSFIIIKLTKHLAAFFGIFWWNLCIKVSENKLSSMPLKNDSDTCY